MKKLKLLTSQMMSKLFTTLQRRAEQVALLSLMFFGFTLFLPTKSFADSRYWILAGQGNWNTAANWASTSNGTGGAGVPTATHTVVLDGAGAKNGNIVLNTAVTITTLTISGYTGTLNLNGYAVTISSNFSQTSGTVQLGTSTLTLQGDVNRTGGNFSAGTSTVTFSGNLNQTLTLGATGFYHMVVNKSANNLNLGSALNVLGSLSVTAGTLDTSASNWSITITSDVVVNGGTFNLNASTMSLGGSWSRTSGAFNAGTSTVTFTSTLNRNIRSGSQFFAHTAITGAGQFTLQDMFVSSGNLTLTSGTLHTGANNPVVVSSNVLMNGGNLTLNASTMVVSGNWTRTSGNFSAGTSTVTFSGGLSQTLSLGATAFYHVVVNKTGGSTLTLGSAVSSLGSLSLTAGTFDTSGSNWSVTVTSDVYINGGTLTLNSSTMSLAGSWSATSGAFNAGSSTVTFTSGVARNIRSGTLPFAHVQFNGAGTFSLADYLTASGNLSLTAGTLTTTASNHSIVVSSDVIFGGGTLQVNASTMTVGGNWTRNSGTFTAGTSTVTFSGTGPRSILSGGQSFYRTVFNGVNGTWTLRDQLTSSGQLTLNNGTLDTSVNNYGILASSDVMFNGGTFTLNASTVIVTGNYLATGGTLNANTSTVTFNGTAARSFKTNNQTFYRLSFNGAAGNWSLQDQLNTTDLLTIANGTLNTTANNFGVNIGGDLYLSGGTFQLNASTMIIAGSWNRTAGTFTAGTSTVTFTASTGKYIKTGAQTFYRTAFNGSGSWTLADQLSSTGQLTMNSGTLDTSVNNYGILASSDVMFNGGTFTLNASTVIVTGNYLATGGTLNANTSTVTFNGTAARSFKTNNQTFYRLSFNGAAGNWSLQDQLNTTDLLTIANGTLNTTANNFGVNVGSDLYLSGGTFQLNGSTMIIAGAWNRTAGTFTAGTSTVTFTSSSPEYIKTGAQTFYRTAFNGSGTWTLTDQLSSTGQLTLTNGTLDTSVNNYGVLASSDVLINGGTFTLNASTMIVNGSWYKTAGTFNSNSSSVTFTGAAAIQNLVSGGSSFNNLIVNKASGVFDVFDPLTILGNYTQTLGTVDISSQSVTASKNWTMTAGSFFSMGSTVTFNSPTYTALTGSTSFYALKAITPNTTLYFTATTTQTVTNMVDFENVFLRSSASNSTWYFNLSGSSQTILSVDVKDSNANIGNSILPNAQSTDSGNNRNWIFNSNGPRYWVSSSAGNWSNASNWGYVSGGNGGASAPTTLQSAIFDGAGGRNGNALVDQDVTVGTITISGYSGTLNTQGYAVTISSSFSQTSGTLTLSTSQVTLQGDFTRTGGNLSAGNSTATFTGAVNQTLTLGATAFANVVVNKSANNLNLGSRFETTGDLTLTAGTFDSSAANSYSVTIGSNVYINGATFNLNNSTMSVAEDWLFTGGAFNAGGSTVTFNSGGTDLILTGLQPFTHVVINGASGTWNLGDELKVQGNLTLTAGTLNSGAANYGVTVTSNVVMNGGSFTLNNSTMTVGGHWTRSAGTFSAGNSTVTFNGLVNQNITSGAQNFDNIVVNKFSGTLALVDALPLNGNFTQTQGTVNTNAQAITIAGDWSRAASNPTLTITGTTVTFNSSTISTLSGFTTFYALRAITPNTTIYFTAGTTQYASNMVDLENVSLKSTSQNATWYFGLTGSSQTLLAVQVQDSNANVGSILLPNNLSQDLGNNRNWLFNQTTKYWVGSAAGVWNNSSNWSYTSGGAGGAPVPTATDNVIFDGTRNGNAIVNQAISIGTLTISGYTGSLNFNGYTVTIASHVSQSSGMLVLSTSAITINGNWTRTGGNLSAGNSTVTFSGGQAETLTDPATSFFHVVVNKTGGSTLSLGSAFSSLGSLSLSAGTLDTTGSNWSVSVTSDVSINGGNFTLNASTMSLGGSWSRTSGSFDAGSSTVTFNSAVIRNIRSGSQGFAHVAITGAGQFMLQDMFVSSGNLTMSAGTFHSGSNNPIVVSSNVIMSGGNLTLNASTMTVGGNWTRTAGNFSAGTSTVTFLGSQNQSLTLGATAFFHVVVNKPGATTLTLGSAFNSLGSLAMTAGTFDTTASNWSVTVTSDVVINGGSFTLNTSTMSLGGSWLNTAGTFTANSSSVTFNGGQAQNVLSNGSSFNHLITNKSAGVLAFKDNTDINGNFTQTAGTTDISSRTVNVAGDWTMTAGNFVALGSTVTFDSPTLSRLTGSTSFYALRALTANTTLYFQQTTTQTVTNMVDFENVYLKSFATNSTWYFNMSGSSQTLLGITVQDSNANIANTLLPNTQSTDGGNNRNWIFGGGLDRYWVSSVTGIWNNTANWSYTSNGLAGAPVPTASNSVYFDSNKNGNAILNQAISVGTITIAGYTGSLNFNGYAVTISSHVSQSSGMLVLSTSAVSLNGNWTKTGGNLSADNSTVTFSGGQSQTLTSGATSFFHVVVNKSGGSTLSLGSAFTSLGSLSLTAGTLDTTGSNWSVTVTSDVSINGGNFTLNASTMSLGGSWNLTSGSLNPGISTVTFNSAVNRNIRSGSQGFAHVAITGAGQFMLQDMFVSSGNLTMTAGTFHTNSTNNAVVVSSNLIMNGGNLTLNGSTMTVGGNWTRTAGNFSAGTSTVTFLGSQNQSLTLGATAFFHVVVNKPGATTLTLGSAFNSLGSLAMTAGTFDTSASNWSVTVTSDVVINGGSFTLNTSTMSLGGSWLNTAGTFTANSSSVTFNGGQAQNVLSNGSSFNHLITNKSAGVLAFKDNTDINGNFTQTAGTTDISSRTVNVAGDWTMTAGNFVALGSTVTFDSPTLSRLTGSTSFYALRALTANTTLYFQQTTTQTVTNMVDFENVYLKSFATNSTWYFNMSGSSQTLLGVTVQDSNANIGNILIANSQSLDGGNNRNWVFGGGVNRYWISSAAGSWSNSANWGYSSGGAGGAPIPTASNTVIFDSAKNGNAIVDQNVTIGTLTISGYTGSLNFNGYNITISSNVSQSSGMLVLSTSAITLNGNWARTGGNLSAGNSTVTFSGAQAQSLTDPATSFYHVVVNKTGGSTLSLGSAFSSLGSLTMTAGTFDTTASNWSVTVTSDVSVAGGNFTLNSSTMSLGGSWSVTSGSFDGGSSTVTFNSAVSRNIRSGSQGFAHVAITGAGQFLLQDMFVSSGNLTMTAGTFHTNSTNNAVVVSSNLIMNGGNLTLNGSTMTVGGNWTRTAGNFSAGTSTVTFLGSQNQSLTLGATAFFHVVVNKPGATTLTLGSAFNSLGSLSMTAGTFDSSASNWSVTVTSDVVINGGSFTLNTSTMSLGGSWLNTSGTFTANSSSVTFNGGQAQNVLSNGSSFNHLITNKSAGVIAFKDNTDINGNFTQTAGTTDISSRTVNVAGDWAMTAGNFVAIGSTVTFDSPTISRLSGSTTFYALRALTPNTTLYFTQGTTQYVQNMIELRNISMKSLSTNSTWYFGFQGSTQTVVGVQVADSNALRWNTVQTDNTSIDLGNNRNWDFGVDARYWVATTAANWNATTSWSRASGGTSGASVPSSTHTVIFDGVNGSNGTANVNATVSISTLIFSGYNGSFNTQGYNLTIANNFSISGSPTLAMSTSVVTIQGNFTKAGGNFSAGQSTFTFSGGNLQSLTSGNTDFCHVIINKSGGTLTLQNRLSAVGNLTLTAGTLDTNSGSNYSVSVTSWVTINGGNFVMNNSTVGVGGNWTTTSGSFTAGGSTIILNGLTTQTFTPNGQTVAHLSINKFASKVDLGGPLSLTGNVNLISGTFNTSSNSVTLAGNWNQNGGVYSGVGTTVTFNGALTTLTGSTTFYGLKNITPAANLKFTAGTTQYVTNMLDLEGTTLRSTTNNSTWYFVLSGSSQTIIGVDVKDSNANNGNLILPDGASVDSGNNRNWNFSGPTAVADLIVSSVSSSTAFLRWTAPTDNVNPWSGSYAIQYSTWSGATFSTTNAQVLITTSNVTSGTLQQRIISGLWTNTTYFFAIWSADSRPNWSSISNTASSTTWANTISNLAYSAVFTSSINFSWTALPTTPSSATAQGYVYNLSTASDFSAITISSTTNGTNFSLYSATGLNADATYYFRVGSINFANVPTYSAVVSTQITAQFSVSLSTNVLNFGSLNAGTTNVISSSITITNTGNATCRIQLAINDAVNWTSTTNATSTDTFRLSTIFKDTLPVSADFSLANDVITTSTATASSTNFARDADVDTIKGINIAPNTTRGLWFRIEMPPISTTTNAQSIYLFATPSP